MKTKVLIITMTVSLFLLVAVSKKPMNQTMQTLSPSEILRTGEDIYKTKCFICHQSGVAGAPRLGDKKAWAPRIERGIDALMITVNNGKGAMPPKGICMDCTSEELKAAAEYMIAQVK